MLMSGVMSRTWRPSETKTRSSRTRSAKDPTLAEYHQAPLRMKFLPRPTSPFPCPQITMLVLLCAVAVFVVTIVARANLLTMAGESVTIQSISEVGVHVTRAVSLLHMVPFYTNRQLGVMGTVPSAGYPAAAGGGATFHDPTADMIGRIRNETMLLPLEGLLAEVGEALADLQTVFMGTIDPRDALWQAEVDVEFPQVVDGVLLRETTQRMLLYDLISVVQDKVAATQAALAEGIYWRDVDLKNMLFLFENAPGVMFRRLVSVAQDYLLATIAGRNVQLAVPAAGAAITSVIFLLAVWRMFDVAKGLKRARVQALKQFLHIPKDVVGQLHERLRMAVAADEGDEGDSMLDDRSVRGGRLPSFRRADEPEELPSARNSEDGPAPEGDLETDECPAAPPPHVPTASVAVAAPPEPPLEPADSAAALATLGALVSPPEIAAEGGSSSDAGEHARGVAGPLFMWPSAAPQTDPSESGPATTSDGTFTLMTVLEAAGTATASTDAEGAKGPAAATPSGPEDREPHDRDHVAEEDEAARAVEELAAAEIDRQMKTVRVVPVAALRRMLLSAVLFCAVMFSVLAVAMALLASNQGAAHDITASALRGAVLHEVHFSAVQLFANLSACTLTASITGKAPLSPEPPFCFPTRPTRPHSPHSPSTRPPLALHSPSTRPPLALHSPSIRPPFALHSPSTRPPLALHSPSTRPPFALHSPSIRPPFALHSPSIRPPFALHSPSIRPPFALHSPHSPSTRPPLALHSPSTRPPLALHSPSTRPPLALHSPSTRPPFALHSPSIRPPFALHSPSTRPIRPPLALHSPSTRPPFALHSPSTRPPLAPFALHSPSIRPPFALHSPHSPSIRPPFALHSPSTRPIRPPFALHSPSIRPPLALHSPSTRPPLALHSPSTRPPFALHSPSTRPPLALHSPSTRPPLALHSPSIRPPLALHSPSTRPPFALHSPSTRPPLALHSPSTRPPLALHSPPIRPPFAPHSPPIRSPGALHHSTSGLLANDRATVRAQLVDYTEVLSALHCLIRFGYGQCNTSSIKGHPLLGILRPPGSIDPASQRAKIMYGETSCMMANTTICQLNPGRLGLPSANFTLNALVYYYIELAMGLVSMLDTDLPTGMVMLDQLNRAMLYDLDGGCRMANTASSRNAAQALQDGAAELGYLMLGMLFLFPLVYGLVTLRPLLRLGVESTVTDRILALVPTESKYSLLLDWQRTQIVGVRSVDDQHKRLGEYAAQLTQAVINGQDRPTQQRLLEILQQFIVHHTGFEVRQAKKYHLSEELFAKHSADHLALLSMVKRASVDLQKGGDLLEFIKAFGKAVPEHIRQHDLPLGKWITTKGKSRL
ncbi:hypothetical protein PAPYR_4877 [Paratrimastix pyriformis]|uniref:Hemerythrin-like domain-containing protein n=1 Tax=Paratrimastix pyriformis TaxID=342808 RepID=A0ABQ8UM77_9EUKA|nr:hypothetical protein PAPYR_4877 [Paratrimastix pyriformis]